MKSCDIQIELKNYKIREAYLLKRSRILREWRKRWIVLTINFLFSFENQNCLKPTQIIDLRQTVSLRTILKPSEESEPNCFHLQTKHTDFAFSASDAPEKWSWIVTIQRLLDFKQKGASHYNNMDMIKSQGFQSQNEFQFIQKSQARTLIKTGKTISTRVEFKKKQMKADELLNKLMAEQQKIKKKEEELKIEEEQLQKERKSNENFHNQIRQLTNQLKQLQEESAFLKQEVFVRKRDLMSKEEGLIQSNFEENSLNRQWMSHQEKQDKENRISEQIRSNRSKCIASLLNEFDSLAGGVQLAFIVEFFLKVSEKEEYKYRDIIYHESHHNHNLSSFMNIFFGLVAMVSCKELKTIYRALVMMRLIFQDQKQLQDCYFVEAGKIVLNWTSQFNRETSLQILTATTSLLELLANTMAKNNQKEQVLERLNYLSQLSEDAEYRQKCRSTIEMITEQESVN